MKESFVIIQDLNLKYQQKAILKDLNWTINHGEHWLISGSSGSGKTALAKTIAGLTDYNGFLHIDFDLQSKLLPTALYVASWYQFKNKEGVANFYYQQRYISQQTHDIPTVNEELIKYGETHQLKYDNVEKLLAALGFSALKNATLIQLSSGEHKKLQLVKALWLKPQLLILDQPYTGLDLVSCQNLNSLLDEVTNEGTQLIMISMAAEKPVCINKFAEITAGKIHVIEFGALEPVSSIEKIRQIPAFLQNPPNYRVDNLIKMVDVNINYGDKQVLKNVNWEVNAGERWHLKGHNGSGKSTLLSLVNGDHPQAYANEIYLFAIKRGSGESIWDIKKHIGLISPEFHWYFDSSSTVKQSIASGFLDSVGLFKELGYEKQRQVDELINYFGLEAHKDELLNVLPLGKQRLALLARAIIKNPELLVLDEPCQGLDQQQTQYFNQLVDELCSNGMTLIYVAHTETQLPTCLTHQLLLNNGEVVKHTQTSPTQKELIS